nr:hypothetical protein [Tanacetum cinerariifolium]
MGKTFNRIDSYDTCHEDFFKRVFPDCFGVVAVLGFQDICNIMERDFLSPGRRRVKQKKGVTAVNIATHMGVNEDGITANTIKLEHIVELNTQADVNVKFSTLESIVGRQSEVPTLGNNLGKYWG